MENTTENTNPDIEKPVIIDLDAGDTESGETCLPLVSHRNEAEPVSYVPDTIPSITIPALQNALTFLEDNAAALIAWKDQDITVIDEKTGRTVIRSKTELVKEYCGAVDKKKPKRWKDLHIVPVEEGEVNLPLLKTIYGIILQEFIEKMPEKLKKIKPDADEYVLDDMMRDFIKDHTVTIYLPDFIRKTTGIENYTENQIKAALNSLYDFETIMGRVRKKNRLGKEVDVMSAVCKVLRYDRIAQTVTITCPYMNDVILQVYKASLRKSKTGLIEKYKNGVPMTNPAYKYIVKSTISKERNKGAVEIVFALIPIIAQAGDHPVEMKFSSILGRCPVLKSRYDNKADRGSRNKLLKSAFTKAWLLLKKETYLYDQYRIADPKDYPTVSTLYKKVLISKGKRKKKQEA